MSSCKQITDRAFSALSGIVDVGVLVLDHAGHVLCANAAACELFGCADRDVLDEHWAVVEPLFHVRPPLPQPGKPLARAVEIRVEDAPRHLRLEFHALDATPEPGWLVLLKDRSSVDALDANLLAATRIHTQAFLQGALSHDLKTPLNSMQITLELLAGALTEASAAPAAERAQRQERYIKVLQDDVARLNRNMNAAMGPPMSAEVRFFDLREVVREVAARLETHTRRGGISFQQCFLEDTVTLRGADDWLKQALLNIAVFSLERIPDEGRMSIECTAQPHMATVTISASGPVVPEPVLGDIHRVSFGAGRDAGAMSLYVARVVIEAFGGEFHVEQAADEVTCFRCLLPRA